MFLIRPLLILALAVVVTGCASPATVEGIVVPRDAAMTFNPAYQDNILMGAVEGGESTNPLWTSELDSATFEKALKASLANAGLLKADGNADYTLKTTLLKADQDLFGINLEVVAQAQYTLKDASDNIVFSKTYQTPYTAGPGDSLMAVKRLRLANEGAAKENIKAFLRGLSQEGVAPK